MEAIKGRYKAFLFDFDGTLVPSLDYWFAGFKHAFAELGREVTDEEILTRCFYRSEGTISADFGLECTKTFWGLVQSKLLTCYDQVTLFPGVLEVLDTFAGHNIPMALVTSSERPVIDRAFSHLPLHKYFDAIVTGSDVVNFKPHPEPILTALSGLGLSAADAPDTFYVGDYLVDAAAGKAAGCDVALFHNDSHEKFHRREHLEASDADFIFSDFTQLLNLLDIRCSSELPQK